MKIYNEVILQWDDESQQYITTYEDSFEYDGNIMSMAEHCPEFGTMFSMQGGCAANIAEYGCDGYAGTIFGFTVLVSNYCQMQCGLCDQYGEEGMYGYKCEQSSGYPEELTYWIYTGNPNWDSPLAGDFFLAAGELGECVADASDLPEGMDYSNFAVAQCGLDYSSWNYASITVGAHTWGAMGWFTGTNGCFCHSVGAGCCANSFITEIGFFWVDGVGTCDTAPTAIAGLNQQVLAGLTVTLDGSQSFDSNGSIIAYEWTQLSGTAVTFADEEAAVTTFTAPSGASSTNIFRLSVFDNHFNEATDHVTVYVIASIQGCTNSSACNYNPDANVDDGSCWVADINYYCDGSCWITTNSPDCSCTQVMDDCGECGGGDVTGCVPSMPEGDPWGGCADLFVTGNTIISGAGGQDGSCFIDPVYDYSDTWMYWYPNTTSPAGDYPQWWGVWSFMVGDTGCQIKGMSNFWVNCPDYSVPPGYGGNPDAQWDEMVPCDIIPFMCGPDPSDECINIVNTLYNNPTGWDTALLQFIGLGFTLYPGSMQTMVITFTDGTWGEYNLQADCNVPETPCCVTKCGFDAYIDYNGYQSPSFYVGLAYCRQLSFDSTQGYRAGNNALDGNHPELWPHSDTTYSWTGVEEKWTCNGIEERFGYICDECRNQGACPDFGDMGVFPGGPYNTGQPYPTEYGGAQGVWSAQWYLSAWVEPMGGGGAGDYWASEIFQGCWCKSIGDLNDSLEVQRSFMSCGTAELQQAALAGELVDGIPDYPQRYSNEWGMCMGFPFDATDGSIIGPYLGQCCCRQNRNDCDCDGHQLDACGICGGEVDDTSQCYYGAGPADGLADGASPCKFWSWGGDGVHGAQLAETCTADYRQANQLTEGGLSSSPDLCEYTTTDNEYGQYAYGYKYGLADQGCGSYTIGSEDSQLGGFNCGRFVPAGDGVFGTLEEEFSCKSSGAINEDAHGTCTTQDGLGASIYIYNRSTMMGSSWGTHFDTSIDATSMTGYYGKLDVFNSQEGVIYSTFACDEGGTGIFDGLSMDNLFLWRDGSEEAGGDCVTWDGSYFNGGNGSNALDTDLGVCRYTGRSPCIFTKGDDWPADDSYLYDTISDIIWGIGKTYGGLGAPINCYDDPDEMSFMISTGICRNSGTSCCFIPASIFGIIVDDGDYPGNDHWNNITQKLGGSSTHSSWGFWQSKTVPALDWDRKMWRVSGLFDVGDSWGGGVYFDGLWKDGDIFADNAALCGSSGCHANPKPGWPIIGWSEGIKNVVLTDHDAAGVLLEHSYDNSTGEVGDALKSACLIEFADSTDCPIPGVRHCGETGGTRGNDYGDYIDSGIGDSWGGGAPTPVLDPSGQGILFPNFLGDCYPDGNSSHAGNIYATKALDGWSPAMQECFWPESVGRSAGDYWECGTNSCGTDCNGIGYNANHTIVGAGICPVSFNDKFGGSNDTFPINTGQFASNPIVTNGIPTNALTNVDRDRVVYGNPQCSGGTTDHVCGYETVEYGDTAAGGYLIKRQVYLCPFGTELYTNSPWYEQSATQTNRFCHRPSISDWGDLSIDVGGGDLNLDTTSVAITVNSGDTVALKIKHNVGNSQVSDQVHRTGLNLVIIPEGKKDFITITANANLEINTSYEVLNWQSTYPAIDDIKGATIGTNYISGITPSIAAGYNVTSHPIFSGNHEDCFIFVPPQKGSVAATDDAATILNWNEPCFWMSPHAHASGKAHGRINPFSGTDSMSGTTGDNSDNTFSSLFINDNYCNNNHPDKNTTNSGYADSVAKLSVCGFDDLFWWVDTNHHVDWQLSNSLNIVGGNNNGTGAYFIDAAAGAVDSKADNENWRCKSFDVKVDCKVGVSATHGAWLGGISNEAFPAAGGTTSKSDFTTSITIDGLFFGSNTHSTPADVALDGDYPAYKVCSDNLADSTKTQQANHVFDSHILLPSSAITGLYADFGTSLTNLFNEVYTNISTKPVCESTGFTITDWHYDFSDNGDRVCYLPNGGTMVAFEGGLDVYRSWFMNTNNTGDSLNTNVGTCGGMGDSDTTTCFTKRVNFEVVVHDDYCGMAGQPCDVTYRNNYFADNLLFPDWSGVTHGSTHANGTHCTPHYHLKITTDDANITFKKDWIPLSDARTTSSCHGLIDSADFSSYTLDDLYGTPGTDHRGKSHIPVELRMPRYYQSSAVTINATVYECLGSQASDDTEDDCITNGKNWGSTSQTYTLKILNIEDPPLLQNVDVDNGDLNVETTKITNTVKFPNTNTTDNGVKCCGTCPDTSSNCTAETTTITNYFRLSDPDNLTGGEITSLILHGNPNCWGDPSDTGDGGIWKGKTVDTTVIGSEVEDTTDYGTIKVTYLGLALPFSGFPSSNTTCTAVDTCAEDLGFRYFKLEFTPVTGFSTYIPQIVEGNYDTIPYSDGDGGGCTGNTHPYDPNIPWFDKGKLQFKLCSADTVVVSDNIWSTDNSGAGGPGWDLLADGGYVMNDDWNYLWPSADEADAQRGRDIYSGCYTVEYDLQRYGCTDHRADNPTTFTKTGTETRPSANLSDGSCRYYGCMHPMADNTHIHDDSGTGWPDGGTPQTTLPCHGWATNTTTFPWDLYVDNTTYCDNRPSALMFASGVENGSCTFDLVSITTKWGGLSLEDEYHQNVPYNVLSPTGTTVKVADWYDLFQLYTEIDWTDPAGGGPGYCNHTENGDFGFAAGDCIPVGYTNDQAGAPDQTISHVFSVQMVDENDPQFGQIQSNIATNDNAPLGSTGASVSAGNVIKYNTTTGTNRTNFGQTNGTLRLRYQLNSTGTLTDSRNDNVTFATPWDYWCEPFNESLVDTVTLNTAIHFDYQCDASLTDSMGMKNCLTSSWPDTVGQEFIKISSPITTSDVLLSNEGVCNTNPHQYLVGGYHGGFADGDSVEVTSDSAYFYDSIDLAIDACFAEGIVQEQADTGEMENYYWNFGCNNMRVAQSGLYGREITVKKTEPYSYTSWNYLYGSFCASGIGSTDEVGPAGSGQTPYDPSNYSGLDCLGELYGLDGFYNTLTTLYCSSTIYQDGAAANESCTYFGESCSSGGICIYLQDNEKVAYRFNNSSLCAQCTPYVLHDNIIKNNENVNGRIEPGETMGYSFYSPFAGECFIKVLIIDADADVSDLKMSYLGSNGPQSIDQEYAIESDNNKFYYITGFNGLPAAECIASATSEEKNNTIYIYADGAGDGGELLHVKVETVDSANFPPGSDVQTGCNDNIKCGIIGKSPYYKALGWGLVEDNIMDVHYIGGGEDAVADGYHRGFTYGDNTLTEEGLMSFDYTISISDKSRNILWPAGSVIGIRAQGSPLEIDFFRDAAEGLPSPDFAVVGYRDLADNSCCAAGFGDLGCVKDIQTIFRINKGSHAFYTDYSEDDIQFDESQFWGAEECLEGENPSEDYCIGEPGKLKPYYREFGFNADILNTHPENPLTFCLYDELLRDSNRGYGGSTYDIIFTGYCRTPDGDSEVCQGENLEEGELPSSFIPSTVSSEFDGLGVPTKFYVDDLFREYGYTLLMLKLRRKFSQLAEGDYIVPERDLAPIIIKVLDTLPPKLHSATYSYEENAQVGVQNTEFIPYYNIQKNILSLTYLSMMHPNGDTNSTNVDGTYAIGSINFAKFELREEYGDYSGIEITTSLPGQPAEVISTPFGSAEGIDSVTGKKTYVWDHAFAAINTHSSPYTAEFDEFSHPDPASSIKRLIIKANNVGGQYNGLLDWTLPDEYIEYTPRRIIFNNLINGKSYPIIHLYEDFGKVEFQLVGSDVDPGSSLIFQVISSRPEIVQATLLGDFDQDPSQGSEFGYSISAAGNYGHNTPDLSPPITVYICSNPTISEDELDEDWEVECDKCSNNRDCLNYWYNAADGDWSVVSGVDGYWDTYCNCYKQDPTFVKEVTYEETIITQTVELKSQDITQTVTDDDGNLLQPHFTGDIDLVFRIQDIDGLIDQYKIRLRIHPVNDPPIIEQISDTELFLNNENYPNDINIEIKTRDVEEGDVQLELIDIEQVDAPSYDLFCDDGTGYENCEGKAEDDDCGSGGECIYPENASDESYCERVKNSVEMVSGTYIPHEYRPNLMPGAAEFRLDWYWGIWGSNAGSYSYTIYWDNVLETDWYYYGTSELSNEVAIRCIEDTDQAPCNTAEFWSHHTIASGDNRLYSGEMTFKPNTSYRIMYDWKVGSDDTATTSAGLYLKGQIVGVQQHSECPLGSAFTEDESLEDGWSRRIIEFDSSDPGCGGCDTDCDNLKGRIGFYPGWDTVNKTNFYLRNVKVVVNANTPETNCDYMLYCSTVCFENTELPKGEMEYSCSFADFNNNYYINMDDVYACNNSVPTENVDIKIAEFRDDLNPPNFLDPNNINEFIGSGFNIKRYMYVLPQENSLGSILLRVSAVDHGLDEDGEFVQIRHGFSTASISVVGVSDAGPEGAQTVVEKSSFGLKPDTFEYKAVGDDTRTEIPSTLTRDFDIRIYGYHPNANAENNYIVTNCGEIPTSTNKGRVNKIGQCCSSIPDTSFDTTDIKKYFNIDKARDGYSKNGYFYEREMADEVQLFANYYTYQGGNPLHENCDAEVLPSDIIFSYGGYYDSDNVGGYPAPNAVINELDHTKQYIFEIKDVVERYDCSPGDEGCEWEDPGWYLWWGDLTQEQQGDYMAMWDTLCTGGSYTCDDSVWDGGEPGHRGIAHPYSVSGSVVFRAGPFSQISQNLQVMIEDGFIFRYDYPSIYKVSVYAEDTYGFIGESYKFVDARSIPLLQQTVLHKYDPMQGLNVTTNEGEYGSFVQNSMFEVEDRDIDKRPALGLYTWTEINKEKSWSIKHNDAYKTSPGGNWTGSLVQKSFRGQKINKLNFSENYDNKAGEIGFETFTFLGVPYSWSSLWYGNYSIFGNMFPAIYDETNPNSFGIHEAISNGHCTTRPGKEGAGALVIEAYGWFNGGFFLNYMITHNLEAIFTSIAGGINTPSEFASLVLPSINYDFIECSNLPRNQCDIDSEEYSYTNPYGVESGHSGGMMGNILVDTHWLFLVGNCIWDEYDRSDIHSGVWSKSHKLDSGGAGIKIINSHNIQDPKELYTAYQIEQEGPISGIANSWMCDDPASSETGYGHLSPYQIFENEEVCKSICINRDYNWNCSLDSTEEREIDGHCDYKSIWPGWWGSYAKCNLDNKCYEISNVIWSSGCSAGIYSGGWAACNTNCVSTEITGYYYNCPESNARFMASVETDASDACNAECYTELYEDKCKNILTLWNVDNGESLSGKIGTTLYNVALTQEFPIPTSDPQNVDRMFSIYLKKGSALETSIGISAFGESTYEKTRHINWTKIMNGSAIDADGNIIWEPDVSTIITTDGTVVPPDEHPLYGTASRMWYVDDVGKGWYRFYLRFSYSELTSVLASDILKRNKKLAEEGLYDWPISVSNFIIFLETEFDINAEQAADIATILDYDFDNIIGDTDLTYWIANPMWFSIIGASAWDISNFRVNIWPNGQRATTTSADVLVWGAQLEILEPHVEILKPYQPTYDSGFVGIYDFVPDVDVRNQLTLATGGSMATLIKYYDKDLHPDAYVDNSAPLTAQLYFYLRDPFEDGIFVEREMMSYIGGTLYAGFIDWGDGSPTEYDKNPFAITDTSTLRHVYEKSGIYEITGEIFNIARDLDFMVLGIGNFVEFSLVINIASNPSIEEEFEILGGTGFDFIPYSKTTPLVSGVHNNSAYKKVLKNQLGIVDDGILAGTTRHVEFKYYSDRLDTEIALAKMDEKYIGTTMSDWTGSFPDVFTDQELIYAYEENPAGEDIEVPIKNAQRGFYGLRTTLGDTAGTWDESTGQISAGDVKLINKGIGIQFEELGSFLGDTDISQIRYFKKSYELYQLLGFDSTAAGNPSHETYFRNIIPPQYNIEYRTGIDYWGYEPGQECPSSPIVVEFCVDDRLVLYECFNSNSGTVLDDCYVGEDGYIDDENCPNVDESAPCAINIEELQLSSTGPLWIGTSTCDNCTQQGNIWRQARKPTFNLKNPDGTYLYTKGMIELGSFETGTQLIIRDDKIIDFSILDPTMCDHYNHDCSDSDDDNDGDCNDYGEWGGFGRCVGCFRYTQFPFFEYSDETVRNMYEIVVTAGMAWDQNVMTFKCPTPILPGYPNGVEFPTWEGYDAGDECYGNDYEGDDCTAYWECNAFCAELGEGDMCLRQRGAYTGTQEESETQGGVSQTVFYNGTNPYPEGLFDGSYVAEGGRMWGEKPFGVLAYENNVSWTGQSENPYQPDAGAVFKLLRGEDSPTDADPDCSNCWDANWDFDEGFGYYNTASGTDHRRFVDDCGVCRYPMCEESEASNPSSWIYNPCNTPLIYRWECVDNTMDISDAELINTCIINNNPSSGCGNGTCIQNTINLVVTNGEWNSTCG